VPHGHQATTVVLDMTVVRPADVPVGGCALSRTCSCGSCSGWVRSCPTCVFLANVFSLVVFLGTPVARGWPP
jgi:hypothetical protein